MILQTKEEALAYFSIPGNIEAYKKQPNGEQLFDILKGQGWGPETVEPAPANERSTPEQVAEANAIRNPALTLAEVPNSPRAIDIAEKYIDLGCYVYFIPRGTKQCTTPNWNTLATRELTKAKALAGDNYLNVILVGKRDGVWTLDFDDPAVLEAYEKDYGTIQTRRHRSVSGGIHLLFLPSEAAWEMGNLQEIDEQKGELWSTRIDNRYVLAPGSVAYPDNDTTKPLTFYEALNDLVPIEAPLSLIAFLKARAGRAAVKSNTDASPNGAKIPHGSHDITLFKIGCKLRQVGLEEEAIYNALVEICEKRCENYGSDYLDMCRNKARQACKYPPGTDSSLILNQTKAQTQAVPQIVLPQVEQYAMTPEEIDAEMEKDFPVIPLVEQAGPTWSDDIMYGIAGEIVRKASQYCEAHPAGMYLDLLVALGSIIGRGPYFNINQTRHYTNEFMARVGLTSESRKGTGRDIIDGLLRMVDAEWYCKRIMSGFGSAEAIVNEIRDPMEQRVRDKKSPTGFQLIIAPGITDKRLCIREGELASVFQLAGKNESRADIVLRDGWDSKILRNIVKGKSHDGLSNSAICTEPHLSISGDTTRTELIAKMPAGAADNGFGNRFLYCYVYRTKMCPNGGPQLDWSKEIPRLYNLIQWARSLTYVPLIKPASKAWARMYMELNEAGNKLTGLARAMTARGDAHIRRLALIYALLDDFDVVETRHLHAAKRMWDYCQESAKYIFTGTTADQDRITDFVRRNREVTVTQITQEVFHKHKKAEWVETQVNSLVRGGHAGITRRDDKIIVG